jgi:hypothetical protein
MDEATILVNCDKMMNKEKMSGDYQRTRDVILSCNNMDQLKIWINLK